MHWRKDSAYQNLNLNDYEKLVESKQKIHAAIDILYNYNATQSLKDEAQAVLTLAIENAANNNIVQHKTSVLKAAKYIFDNHLFLKESSQKIQKALKYMIAVVESADKNTNGNHVTEAIKYLGRFSSDIPKDKYDPLIDKLLLIAKDINHQENRINAISLIIRATQQVPEQKQKVMDSLSKILDNGSTDEGAYIIANWLEKENFGTKSEKNTRSEFFRKVASDPNNKYAFDAVNSIFKIKDFKIKDARFALDCFLAIAENTKNENAFDAASAAIEILNNMNGNFDDQNYSKYYFGNYCKKLVNVLSTIANKNEFNKEKAISKLNFLFKMSDSLKDKIAVEIFDTYTGLDFVMEDVSNYLSTKSIEDANGLPIKERALNRLKVIKANSLQRKKI